MVPVARAWREHSPLSCRRVQRTRDPRNETCVDNGRSTHATVRAARAARAFPLSQHDDDSRYRRRARGRSFPATRPTSRNGCAHARAHAARRVNRHGVHRSAVFVGRTAHVGALAAAEHEVHQQRHEDCLYRLRERQHGPARVGVLVSRLAERMPPRVEAGRAARELHRLAPAPDADRCRAGGRFDPARHRGMGQDARPHAAAARRLRAAGGIRRMGEPRRDARLRGVSAGRVPVPLAVAEATRDREAARHSARGRAARAGRRRRVRSVRRIGHVSRRGARGGVALDRM
ncbi:putative dNA methylase [Burkholderia pseudomallei MSHR3951]|nr:putative dNA methylase [Burkholderia pseudomallei MSHR3951]